MTRTTTLAAFYQQVGQVDALPPRCWVTLFAPIGNLSLTSTPPASPTSFWARSR